MKFEWDEIKNIKKHRVSFYEAKTVFYDYNALYEYDDDHLLKSITEEKFRAYLKTFIADYGWNKEFVNSEVDSVFK